MVFLNSEGKEDEEVTKSVAIMMVALMALCGVASANVTQIGLLQALGGNADYDAGTGVAVWSQGASGWAMTTDFGFISFSNVQISATFSGIDKLSSGGRAMATFSSGNWLLAASGGMIGAVPLPGTFTIAGHLHSLYRETETAVDSDALDGRAVVVVDSFDYSEDDSLEWVDGIGSLAGLVANISLPDGTNIINYDSDYHSTNNIVTLDADESSVPEPATMGLLAIGSMLFIRRRRA